MTKKGVFQPPDRRFQDIIVWLSGFPQPLAPAPPPHPEALSLGRSYPQPLAIFKKFRVWWVIRYSHFFLPASLTNPRKSATCTLARRDWNDYLILIAKNFHPKRTSEFDTN
jgi:hypothetical protein